MEKRIIPKFATEAEEAKWWFDNQEELGKDFAHTFAEGRLRRRTEPRPAQRFPHHHPSRHRRHRTSRRPGREEANTAGSLQNQ
jgi:hypothetical protein